MRTVSVRLSANRIVSYCCSPAADAVDAGVAYILEGGYGLDTLAQGVATVHETYDGRTPTPQTGSVDSHVMKLIQSMSSFDT